MKAAIYTRLSEEDRNKLHKEDDSNSIQNQKTMLIQYAMSHGWEIYDIYNDDDYAGADRRRPQFNRLLKDAEERKFDIVLCKTQSRFTRELELVEKYLHGLFPLWGIRFISIVDNADTDNKGNKKSRQINGLVNEWYLEDMSENIRSVLTSRRENGFHIGAFAPYGYQKDPDKKGHLIIDPEAAAVVREIYTLFAKGYGKTAIARILNDRGIPNPTQYKRLHGIRYQNPATHNSTLWKYFTISDILVNEVYIGNLVQGKYGSISYKTRICKPRPRNQWIYVEGTHEPIIDRELWNNVQFLIAQKAKPFETGQIGLFAKKVRCANCGYVMRSSKNRGRHYLQCQTRYISSGSCIGAFIPVKELEALVLQELHRLSSEFLDRDMLEREVELSSDLNVLKAQILADITAYERKVADLNKGLRDAYIDKVKGIISESDFILLSAEFTSQKNRYFSMTELKQKQLEEVEEKIAAGENRQKRIAHYVDMNHLSRETVDILIDHITIGRRDKKTKAIPTDIYWNF